MEVERAEITIPVCCKMRGLPLFLQQTNLLQEECGGLDFIGASLSEPHTSGTALRRCVCMYTTDRACGHIP